MSEHPHRRRHRQSCGALCASERARGDLHSRARASERGSRPERWDTTMSELPPHAHFRHYSELPYSQRMFFTCGAPCPRARLSVRPAQHLFHLRRARGRQSAAALDRGFIVAYSGSGKGSVLEGALRGPMATMLPTDERTPILAWANEGRVRAAYDQAVAGRSSRSDASPATTAAIRICQPHDYDEVKQGDGERHRRLGRDAGARIAHPPLRRDLHLLHRRARCSPTPMCGRSGSNAPLIALPFLAIVIDVSSWYLIKRFHPFVFVEDRRRHDDGRLFRRDVAVDPLSDVVHEAAGNGTEPREL